MPKLKLFLPFVALLASCTTSTPPEKTSVPPAAPVIAAPGPVPGDSGMIRLQPLTGAGIRFNGVYDSPVGNIHYIMRFFQRGNVALVAGRQEPGDPVDLASLLTMNVKSGVNNIHNVPVTHRGDSLFFTTMAARGAITYAGKVDGDTLRFLKASAVTGKHAVVAYGFKPDSLKQ